MHRLKQTTAMAVDAIISSDAGAAFDWELARGFSSIISRTVRTTDILMKRVGDFERTAVDADSPGGGTPVIACSIRNIVSADEGATLDENLQAKISLIRTDLDLFSSEEMQLLIAHGYAVARKSCSGLVGLPDKGADSHLEETSWTPKTLGKKSISPEKLAKLLKSSRVRRASLWNSKDAASWVLAGIVSLVPTIFAASLLFNAAFLRNSLKKEVSFDVSIVGQGQRTTANETLTPFRASSGQLNVGCDESKGAAFTWPLPPEAELEGAPSVNWTNTDNIVSFSSNVAPAVGGNLLTATGVIRGRSSDALPFGIRNCPGGGHGELVLTGVYRARSTVRTPITYPLKGQLADTPLVFTLPTKQDVSLDRIRIVITSKETGQESTLEIPVVQSLGITSVTSLDGKFRAELNDSTLTIMPK